MSAAAYRRGSRLLSSEAVASAADAYRQKRTGAGPLDAALARLRSLT